MDECAGRASGDGGLPAAMSLSPMVGRNRLGAGGDAAAMLARALRGRPGVDALGGWACAS